MAFGQTVPDLAAIDVAVGHRVLVVSDLMLGPDASPSSRSSSFDLAQAIWSWAGPGMVVFNGNLFDLLRPAAAITPNGVAPGETHPGQAGEPGADRDQFQGHLETVLGSHPELADALARFSRTPGRFVLILPGSRDGRLAWDPADADVACSRLGARLALAVELSVATAGGTRKIRIEPGHALDPANAFVDPRNELDTPLGHHLITEVLPAIGATKGDWLKGMDRLVDRSGLARFVASRLAYRRVLSRSWWLAIPVLAALLVKFPLAFLFRNPSRAHLASDWSGRLLFVGITTLVDLILFVTLTLMASRRAWGRLRASPVGVAGSIGNEPARARARGLINHGYTGLITSHTLRPELAHLGQGFYANTGAATEVVEERPAWIGLPPVFLAHRQLSWVELEAGADLHVRLLQGRQSVPGANWAERTALKGTRPQDPHPQVVASFPQGESWPSACDPVLRRRRVRRWSAAAIALAGLANFLSAVTPPVERRLRAVLHLVPLGVSETADALVALSGIGLLGLARGVRRGQRQAWTISVVLLAGTALLNVIKGVDVEETVVCLLAAAFLFVNRRHFDASVDRPSVRRGLTYLAGGVILVTLAATAALEATLALSRHHHPLGTLSAIEAVAERLVGLASVALPHRLDEFLRPALAAIGLGLAAFALFLGFRPVVDRRVEAHQSHKAGLKANEAVLTPGDGQWARDDLRPGEGPVPAELDAQPSHAPGWRRAQHVVDRWGRGTLDYFALRSDKQYFFDHESLVSYAVYGGVCLVSPDPIGPEAERDQVWSNFRRHADRHGWTVALIGAGEEWLPIYRAGGMHDMYVGDEAVVDVANFTLDGGKNKGLRQAVNRIAKYGYTISFYDPAHVDASMGDRLRKVMTKSRQGDVERGFSMTLGRVLDPADKGLLLAVASDPDGNPVAFCQYVPAPGVNGYSLDLMRRDEGDHPNGLIDFVVVETIRHLKEANMGGLGLNFATMRAVVAGESGDSLAQRSERWLLKKLSGSMQIESLWKFNAKYDPSWLPRYAVYDSPEHMVAVAVAIARAESFWEIPVIGRFLVPSERRTAQA